MIDVSIIIVNYNTSKLVNDSIESIITKTEGITYEIIIVDNNTENLKQKIVYSNQPYIKIVQLKENIGFGRANNEGLSIANGRNIIFLNPDTILINNAIKILSDYLDTNEKCGACGGNLYDENLQPTRSFRRIFPSINSLIFSTISGEYYEKLMSKGIKCFNPGASIIQVAYIVGADLMVRKSILDDIGGFNPEFFMYYEEIELCHRIKSAGYDIVNIPQAKIQHLEGKSGTIGERKATMHYKSSQTYHRLTLSESKYNTYNYILSFIIRLRIVLSKLTGRKNSLKFWSIWKNLHTNR